MWLIGISKTISCNLIIWVCCKVGESLPIWKHLFYQKMRKYIWTSVWKCEKIWNISFVFYDNTTDPCVRDFSLFLKPSKTLELYFYDNVKVKFDDKIYSFFQHLCHLFSAMKCLSFWNSLLCAQLSSVKVLFAQEQVSKAAIRCTLLLLHSIKCTQL